MSFILENMTTVTKVMSNNKTYFVYSW